MILAPRRISEGKRWRRSSAAILLFLALSGCAATIPLVSPKCYEPFRDSAERKNEFAIMSSLDLFPYTRAWIKEADRVIRANNTLADCVVEEAPWWRFWAR